MCTVSMGPTLTATPSTMPWRPSRPGKSMPIARAAGPKSRVASAVKTAPSVAGGGEGGRGRSLPCGWGGDVRSARSALDGAPRVVAGVGEEGVQPASAEPDVAAAEQRIRERVLEQAGQGQVMSVGVHADDPHQLDQGLDGRLGTEDLGVDGQLLGAG